MDISLELYKTFVCVAKNASFSNAGKELFVSQSAVSQSIKLLEEKAGFPLFVRTTKKVSLTPKGELLYESLVKAFGIIKSAEQALFSVDDPFAGELTIAATDTLCKYYLMPKIKNIHNKYPNIKIKIINGTSFYCMELLEQGKIDFAVVNIPKSIDRSRFMVEKSYSFKDVFVAGQDFPIGENLTLKEISAYPLLVLDEKSYTRNFLDAIFKKHGIKIKPEIELQNIDILLEMATIGLGISFVPDLCLVASPLKVIKVREDFPPREYGILSLLQLPLSGTARTFVSNS